MVARALLCNPQSVYSCFSMLLEWLSECCYAVTSVYSGFYVARVFRLVYRWFYVAGYSVWLSGCCCAFTYVFIVDFMLLGCSEGLLGCCYAVTCVLTVGFVLVGCFPGGCLGFAMQLSLFYSGFYVGRELMVVVGVLLCIYQCVYSGFYVARVFRVVVGVLLCIYQCVYGGFYVARVFRVVARFFYTVNNVF